MAQSMINAMKSLLQYLSIYPERKVRICMNTVTAQQPGAIQERSKTTSSQLDDRLKTSPQHRNFSFAKQILRTNSIKEN
jgi:hypothetical protein